MNHDLSTMNKKIKQYILKPGIHQFAPGSAAIHTNNNLTDAEAKWYLKKYPHIISLFESLPDKKTSKTTSNLPEEVTV